MPPANPFMSTQIANNPFTNVSALASQSSPFSRTPNAQPAKPESQVVSPFNKSPFQVAPLQQQSSPMISQTNPFVNKVQPIQQQPMNQPPQQTNPFQNSSQSANQMQKPVFQFG
jgi:hypothetical protein